MRLFIFALTLLTSAISFASFDMMLIADNTNGMIHRYDPINRVYLGNFGAGALAGPITSMAIDQSGSRVFVYDGFRIAAFNYNTGEGLWSSTSIVGLSSMSYRASLNTMLYTSVDTKCYQTSALTGSILTSSQYFSGASNLKKVLSIGDLVYTIDVLGNMARLFGSSTGTANAVLANPTFVGDTLGDIDSTEDGSNILVSNSTDKTYSISNSTFTINAVSSTSLNTLNGHVNAHDSFFYMYGTNGVGVPSIQRGYDNYVANSLFSQWALPSTIASASKIVMVVAPEPASLLVIGTGLLALLKSKRSR